MRRRMQPGCGYMHIHTFFFNPIWLGYGLDTFGALRDTVLEIKQKKKKKKRRRRRWKPKPLNALMLIDLLPLLLLLLLLLTPISSLVFFFSSDLLHLLPFTRSPLSSSSSDLFFFSLRPNLFLLRIFLFCPFHLFCPWVCPCFIGDICRVAM